MPKTLRKEATGPDVILLQSTLNARSPSALPSLDIDGIFGPLPLARVKEFQRNNRLRVTGIVGSVTWRKLKSGTPIAKPTFYVQGRYLDDPRGNMDMTPDGRFAHLKPGWAEMGV